jgi:hypothetical protein
MLMYWIRLGSILKKFNIKASEILKSGFKKYQSRISEVKFDPLLIFVDGAFIAQFRFPDLCREMKVIPIEVHLDRFKIINS